MTLFKKGDLMVANFTANDIDAIKADVRDIDTEDIRVLFNLTPERSIVQSAKVSTYVFTVFLQDRVVAILGLFPETFLSDKALIWMVTSKSINKIPVSFLRGSKVFVNHLFDLYRSFHGIVRNENVCSLNWMRWMGASMIDHGSFHSFTLEKQ